MEASLSSEQTTHSLSTRRASSSTDDCHSLSLVIQPDEPKLWQSLSVSPARGSLQCSTASLRLVSPSQFNLSPDDSAPDSLSSSPLSQVMKSSIESSDSDQKFKIRNTETGEEVDLRDENKQDFVSQLNKVLQAKSDALEHF